MKKILLILIVSLFVIFFRFNQVPKNLAFDEVEFTKLALSLDNKSYTPYSTYATGHSTLYFYILLSSFKIFGVNNFGLRFPSALFALINVILFYQLMTICFNKKKKKTNFLVSNLPLILSLIFVTSRWYFNFSRFAFEVTFLLFLELSSIFFLFQYLKSKSYFHIILTSFFAGLAFNSYPSGRIFFILPFTFILLKRNLHGQKTFSLFQHSNQGNILNCVLIWSRTKKQLIIGSLIFILTIIPLSTYFIKNHDIRINQELFFKDKNLSLTKKSEFLARNIINTSLMFFVKGDSNGRHNYPYKPALNPVLGTLFLMGLYKAFRRLKKTHNSFFIFYLIISIIPSILTYPWENPNMLRTFVVIPSVIFFIGQGIIIIINNKFLYNRKTLVQFTLIILLFSSSLYELRTYFKYQSQVFKNSFEIETTIDNLWKKKYIFLDHKKIQKMF